MSDLRQAAQQALEVFANHFAKHGERGEMPLHLFIAHSKLRAALAAAQEPVAWMNDEGEIELSHKQWMPSVWQPLYTHPAPAAQPLTDEQIASACMSYRHDFGLLSWSERMRLMSQAREWDRALGKERGVDISYGIGGANG